MAEAEPRRPKFNIDVPMPTKPPVDPLAEEEDEEEPEQSGARNALTEAARRFFSPDTAAPQPARPGGFRHSGSLRGRQPGGAC